MIKDRVARVVSQAFGASHILSSVIPIGGGCINQCYRLNTNGQAYFLKMNEAKFLNMFEMEYKGLTAIASNSNLLVPDPITSGIEGDSSYLIMEFIHSSGREERYWENLGEGLAYMHQSSSRYFGWGHNNYIGRLFQSNRKHLNWLDFFVKERLQPQIQLAEDAGKLPVDVHEDLEKMCNTIDQFINNDTPALLHGDLWSGNIMTGPQGNPCLVDPAVYYGNREVELAFTTLFGGFDERFYQAYYHSFPLTSGHQERYDVYNLYPLLVHLNLFGSGYLGRIRNILESYL